MGDHETFPFQSDREPSKTVHALRTNRLLEALPAAVRHRLQGRARSVTAQQILYDSCRPGLEVYFPQGHTAISLLRSTDEGPQVEVGMIGSEGFASLDVLLARGSIGESAAVAQLPGDVVCVDAGRLHAEFSTDIQTRTLINAYAGMFLEQLSQTALCNGVHSVTQRLSKWLLIMREHSGSSDLSVSHESLSRILGTHRPAVTLAIGALTSANLILHSRRSIHVRDVHGLRARACSCLDPILKSLTRFRAQL